MLTFIGLGLYDKTDVPEKGLRCIRTLITFFLNTTHPGSWALRMKSYGYYERP